jgi:competence protein ComEC
MNLMNPACVVVSVGRKPDTDAHNLYKRHCNKVWSTRWLGNMRSVIDDAGGVTYSLQYGDRL